MAKFMTLLGKEMCSLFVTLPHKVRIIAISVYVCLSVEHTHIEFYNVCCCARLVKIDRLFYLNFIAQLRFDSCFQTNMLCYVQTLRNFLCMLWMATAQSVLL